MVFTLALRSGLVASLLVGMTAGYAAAGPAPDLTGTWEGRWNCTRLRNGVRQRFTEKATQLQITHVSDDNVRARIIGVNANLLYNGLAESENAKPQKGAVTFVACRTNPKNTDYDEVISIDFSFTPINPSLRGSSAYSYVGSTRDIGGTCKYTFTRVSTNDPGVGACP